MERFYRKSFAGNDLVYFDVKCEQTDLRIATDTDLHDKAKGLVDKYRGHIENYIKENNEFLLSLKPITVPLNAADIVRKMCQAAQKVNVGPMAAVAGAIGEFVGNDLLKYSEEVIIENGGDLFVKSNHYRRVGIYAGESPFTGKLAIEIPPSSVPIGICTSSGTIGHSLSFGKADAAMIMSEDVSLSDAMATAMGNLVSTAQDIEKGLNYAKCIPEVKGALIIVGDKIGAWGEIKLVTVKCDYQNKK